MTYFARTLTAAALAGALAAPAAAQYPYQQPYQPTYPQTYPGTPGYGYQQGYGTQGTVGAIIDQLLGNRYNVTDRQAVSQCASAVIAQAQNQYRGGYGGGYGNGYGGGYGNGYGALRVTAITDVQRRTNGLRVRGTLGTGYGGGGYNGYNGYNGQNAYQNGGYRQLNFRCNVDYRGVVTDIRIDRNDDWRR